MTDVANLVLAIDSTQVARGTAALDGLTAAGARAEAATVGLGTGFKGAGAEASAMAAAAQLSARAAMDQAAGFGAAAQAARTNTLALRETLVVTRELMRGNYTRIPGSLMLLGQGAASQGGFGAFASGLAQTLGIIKQVQNAELAEAAVAATTAAAGVEAAARKAAANVLAADTEIALAEAQMRVAEGATAEAAAQARLAAANEAVAAASTEATIAQDALAVAMGHANEAQAASAAATRTLIGGSTVGLLGVGTVAGLAYAAIKQFEDQVKDSGALDKYAESLRLTDEQVKKLGGSVSYAADGTRTISGLTVSMGDVMHGVWQEIGKEAGQGGVWDSVKSAAGEGFNGILSAWDKTSAALTAGLWTLGDIAKDIFGHLGEIVGDGFYSAVNASIGAINGLVNHLPGLGIAGINASALPSINNPYAGAASRSYGRIQHAADANYAAALAQNHAAYAGIESAALAHRRSTMLNLSNRNKPKKAKKPKKANDHGLQEALDKLNAEIKGQYDLATAYGVSGAAAQRAIAYQKAADDAISHKGGLDQFKALELQKLVATDIANAAKKNAALQVETSIRAQLNGQIADGTLNIASYNEQLKLQTTLQGLGVDLENADAQHKQQVRDVIKQTIDLQTQQLQLESQLSALKQIASNDNEIQKMQLENSLMGVSNRERATAIAQLEAMQQLKSMPGLSVGDQRNYVQSAIDKAVAGVQTPFQQWAKDIPQTSAAITEALQGIEVKGLDSLASGIAGVVTGTEKLGQVFKDVARSIIGDIVQMTVKMLIFRAISSIFGNAMTGFGGDPTGAGNNMFGDLSGVQMSVGTIATAPASIPGFAGGGSMIIGGNSGVDNNLLSLNGSPIARVGAGETLAVYPNGPRAAANNNAPQVVELRIATDGNFKAEVAQVAGQVVVTAAPTLVKQAVQTTLKVASRPKISGGR